MECPETPTPFNDNNNREEKNLIAKYALNKKIKIYLTRKTYDDEKMIGIIEEVKDGFLFFKEFYKDRENEIYYHIINLNQIIDIEFYEDPRKI